VPEGITFATKAAIALAQLRQARADRVPTGVVLGDAAYGNETDFRVGVRALDLAYVLGVQSSTTVWPPGTAPLSPRPRPQPSKGRPQSRLQRPPGQKPVSLVALAAGLSRRAWRTVTWREGGQAALASRFAALRVRPAHRDETRSEPWPGEWLLIEWPKGEAEPAKYWLSNLPPSTTLKQLVHTAKARWLVERDHQELKQEIGLGHYEGRGWRGVHHHASLCVAAHGLLVAERCLFPRNAAPGASRSRRLRHPAVCSRAAPPVRPERHVPHSIASIRRCLAVALIRALPRCPCCLQKHTRPATRK
jgi:SRSO17 transposase